MHDDRLTFLAAAHGYRPILAHPNVVERWHAPSILRDWTVGGLAAHAARAVLVVESYLGQPVDAEEMAISAAEYYASVMTSNDPGDELNSGIRARADETAAAGHAHVIADYDKAMDRLRSRLTDEPVDRNVTVFQDRVISLDDYLRTRIVELVVHADDVCTSAEIDAPHLPGLDVAIATLVDVARHRHGDLAVIRALARRERDTVEALRVF